MGKSHVRGILAVTVGLAGVLVLAQQATVAADEIHMRDGQVTAQVEVVEETCKEVVFQYEAARGVKSRVSAAEVLRVEYSNQPSSMRKGIAAKNAMRFAEAIGYFKTAMRATNRQWVKQYSLNYLAESMFGSGDAAGAVDTWKTLLREFPETRFLGEARLGIAAALLSTGDKAGAVKAFADARQAVESKSLGKYWQLRVRLAEVAVDVVAKEWQAAKGKYDNLVRDSNRDGFDDVVAQAQVGASRARVELGDIDGASQDLRDLVESDSASDALLAAAYTLLGRCYGKSERQQDALMAYLRVVVLFPHVTSEAPRAFYEAAAVLTAMGGEQNTGRARQLTRELKERFPQSEWAQKAE